MVTDSTTAAAVESEIEPEGVVWEVADGAVSTETIDRIWVARACDVREEIFRETGPDPRNSRQFSS